MATSSFRQCSSISVVALCFDCHDGGWWRVRQCAARSYVQGDWESAPGDLRNVSHDHQPRRAVLQQAAQPRDVLRPGNGGHAVAVPQSFGQEETDVEDDFQEPPAKVLDFKES